MLRVSYGEEDDEGGSGSFDSVFYPYIAFVGGDDFFGDGEAEAKVFAFGAAVV